MAQCERSLAKAPQAHVIHRLPLVPCSPALSPYLTKWRVNIFSFDRALPYHAQAYGEPTGARRARGYEESLVHEECGA